MNHRSLPVALFVIVLLLIAAVVARMTIQSTRPTQTALPDLIDTVAETIEREDFEGLCDLCTEEPPSRAIFESLVRQHEGLDYRTLFEEQKKNIDNGTFKLGGHGPRFSHLHLDFARRDGGWVLKKIWQCR